MEIAIISKAKQGYIYKYMLQNNMTAGELAKRIGITPGEMGKIINFQWLPTRKITKKGTIKESSYIKKLEDYFKIPIEILFPPEITNEIAKKLQRKYVQIKEVELVQLEGINQKHLIYDNGNNEEAENLCNALTPILSTITAREEKVIRLIYGIK